MTEDPVLALARALTDAHDQVQVELDGAGPREVDRALQFLLSALSAPVSADQTYRLRGDVGDAVYAGVQVYTKGPGYNAPSASISDTDLVDADGRIDLTIGGERPTHGGAWVPLVEGDDLVMVRHITEQRHLPDIELIDVPNRNGAPS
jgi:hypothetical protein